MITPKYFTVEKLKIEFKINLQKHNVNHANSLLTFELNFPDFIIEARYFNTILKELAITYVRLVNQYIFKYNTFFKLAFIRLMKKFKEVMKLNFF